LGSDEVNRKLVIAMVVAVLALAAGMGWWFTRPRDLWGGIRPYMQDLSGKRQATAEQLSKPGPLPEDFTPMEQVVQMSKDVFAVFRNDARYEEKRFAPLAMELMRRADRLESAWDNRPREETSKAFAAFSAACEDCHKQLAPDKRP
jgi:hypothetical protein